MRNILRCALIVMALTVMLGSVAAAQAVNAVDSISLNATLQESLTLTLSTKNVNFSLVPGAASNPGSNGVVATTAWVLKPGRTNVSVYAYFSSTNALTDGAGNNIPSSAFQISNNAGAATAVSGTFAGFGVAGSALRLENITITGANKNASATDNMTFNIDLSSLAQLPAATYTGLLNIQAQATP